MARRRNRDDDDVRNLQLRFDDVPVVPNLAVPQNLPVPQNRPVRLNYYGEEDEDNGRQMLDLVDRPELTDEPLVLRFVDDEEEGENEMADLEELLGDRPELEDMEASDDEPGENSTLLTKNIMTFNF